MTPSDVYGLLVGASSAKECRLLTRRARLVGRDVMVGIGSCRSNLEVVTDNRS